MTGIDYFLMNIIHLDFYKYIEKRFEKINNKSTKINIIDNYILASELYNINILKYLLYSLISLKDLLINSLSFIKLCIKYVL